MGYTVGPAALGDHADADALADAIHRSYARAGITDPATQIDVAELYAPFSSVELHAIEAAGLCGKGESFGRIAALTAFLARPGPSSTLPAAPCAPTRSPSPVSSARPRWPCRLPDGLGSTRCPAQRPGWPPLSAATISSTHPWCWPTTSRPLR